MPNAFDQFDSGTATLQTPRANPFDQFDESVSGGETAAEHLASSVGPGAAFALAAPRGAAVGAEIGAAIPGLGETGIPEAVGAFVGGLISGGVASWAAYKAQHAALSAAAPKFTEEMDKRLEAGAEQHPFAAIAGDVAANLPSMELSVPKLAQLPFRAAAGAAFGAGVPLLEGRKPSEEDIASGAATAALYGRSRFELTPRERRLYAIPKRSAETVPLGETPGDRGAVVEGIPTPRETAKAQAEQEALPLAPQDPFTLTANETGGWEITDPKNDVVESFEPHQREEAIKRTAQLNENAKGVKPASPIEQVDLQKGAVKPTPTAENEPWQMTSDDYFNQEIVEHPEKQVDDIDLEHEQSVRAAIASGNPVPTEVLADYPDLAAKKTPPAKPPQISDEDMAAIERGAAEAGVGVEYAKPGENEPFSRGGFATINRQSGAVTIDPGGLKDWLDNFVPAKNRQQAIRSVVWHERLHLAADDAQAKAYWSSLSPIEQAIRRHSYSQSFSGRTLPDMTDALWGHEALRYRMEQLLHLTPQELVQSVGLEHWTLRSLDAVEGIVRGFRRISGNTEGRYIAERILNNLSLAKASLSSATPLAIDKNKITLADARAVTEWRKQAEMELRKVEGIRKRAPLNQSLYQKAVSAELKAAWAKSVEDQAWDDFNTARIEALSGPAGEKRTPATGTTGEPFIVTPGQLESKWQEWAKSYAGKQENLPQAIDPQRIREEADRQEEAAKEYEASGDKESAEELRQRVKWLREQSEQQAFPAARPPTFERRDYSPEDLRRYEELSRAVVPQSRAEIDTPDFQARWKEFEDLRNKYGGMPPSNLPGATPMARPPHRKELPETTGQLGFILPGSEVRGAMEERKVVPKPSPVSAEEAGALPRLSGVQLEQRAGGFVRQQLEAAGAKKPPSFADFVRYMQRQMERVRPEQLRELWQKQVGEYLASAPGEKLSQIAKSLFGSESMMGQAKIADPPPTGEFKLEPVPDRTWVERGQDERRMVRMKNFRERAIGQIYRRLMQPVSREESLPAQRKAVTPSEIRYGGGKAISAFQQFDASAQGDPGLGDMLVDESRTSAGASPSLTRRLTVLQNKHTGQIEMVSTYRHPTRGTVLLDPILPQGEHSPLESILKRYRVLQSILLDSPVKKFRQSFKDLDDYNRRFGGEARENYAAETSYDPRRVPISEFIEATGGGRIEGGEGLPGVGVEAGEGGMYQGPHKALVQESGEGALEAGEHTPMTDAEAAAMIDHVFSEQGTIESPDDVREAMIALAEMPASKRNNAAVSGFAKLGRALQNKHPELSTDDLLRMVAKHIYENHASAKNLNQFTRQTMAESGAETGPPAETSELERQATPYEKRVAAGRSQLPAARKPAREALEDARAEIAGKAAVFANQVGERFTRADNLAKMVSDINRASTEPVILDQQAQQSVRLASMDPARKQPHGDPERLAGANALIASGAIKQRIRYSQDALREIGRMATEDEELIKLDRFAEDLRSKGPDITKTQQVRQSYVESFADGEKRLAKIQAILKHPQKPDVEARLLEDLRRTRSNQRMRRAKIKEIDERLAGGQKHRGAVEEAQRTVRNYINRRLMERGFIGMRDIDYFFDGSTAVKSKLDEFMQRVRMGRAKAGQTILRGGLINQFKGRRWRAAADILMRELVFARDHWTDQRLIDTAIAARRELDRQFLQEAASGKDLRYNEVYLPGRYDAEVLTPHKVYFGQRKILGRTFQKEAKQFPTYYHAIENDAYLPASRDIASLVGHRVRQGQSGIARRLWWNALKHVRDEATDSMVASEKPDLLHPDTNEWKLPGGGTVYIHEDYSNLVHQLMDPSWVQHNEYARAALNAAMFLKHTALVGDVFHLSRLTGYGLAFSGHNLRILPGWAALDIRPADIPIAVEKGVIDRKTANWLMEPVNLRRGNQLTAIPRVALVGEFTREGFNVGQIRDAIYQDLVRNIPLVGRYNRFLFGKVTRGLMMHTAIKEFERLSRLEPQTDSRVLVKRVAKDLNVFFGSLGRNSVFRSRTMQDLSRLVFLAPQWSEGLVRKELQSTWTLGRHPIRSLTGREPMVRAMARGLVGMLALTQVINLITRGVPTWKNDRRHKWDASLPDNVWISPLAMYNEVLGDILRYRETKPTTWDAIQQIGENKLGFYGRAATVLLSGQTPGGRRIMSSVRRPLVAAEQLIPAPITLNKLVQHELHRLAPGMVPAADPAQAVRSTAAIFGLKAHAGLQPVSQVSRLADEFVKENHLRDETTLEVPTDEPGYSQLRHAIQLGDWKAAEGNYRALLATHRPAAVIQAMKLWERRPFTGSHAHERLFVAGLSDEDRQLYDAAVNQKRELYEKFLDWMQATKEW